MIELAGDPSAWVTRWVARMRQNVAKQLKNEDYGSGDP